VSVSLNITMAAISKAFLNKVLKMDGVRFLIAGKL